MYTAIFKSNRYGRTRLSGTKFGSIDDAIAYAKYVAEDIRFAGVKIINSYNNCVYEITEDFNIIDNRPKNKPKRLEAKYIWLRDKKADNPYGVAFFQYDNLSNAVSYGERLKENNDSFELFEVRNNNDEVVCRIYKK